MSQHLSMAQRHTIVVLHDEGYSTRQIARRVQCTPRTVRTTIERYEQTGTVNEREGRGRPPSLNPSIVQGLRRHINRYPSDTGSDLANWIYDQYRIRVSERTI